MCTIQLLSPPHTAETQTSDHQPSSDHSVFSHLTQKSCIDTHHPADSLTHNQSEYPMASNPQTADALRLRELSLTRHRPRGSRSFQRSWTHRADLFPNSSESPQTLQTSNSLGQCVPAFTITEIWRTEKHHLQGKKSKSRVQKRTDRKPKQPLQLARNKQTVLMYFPN